MGLRGEAKDSERLPIGRCSASRRIASPYFRGAAVYAGGLGAQGCTAPEYRMETSWALGSHWRWACVSLAAAAQAQILIGQTAGFQRRGGRRRQRRPTAPNSISTPSTQGRGQRPEDRADPDGRQVRAQARGENIKLLITEKNVAALFPPRSTPTTQAIMPLLERYKVPLIGPSTGAMVLQAGQPWVFNMRATTSAGAERAVTTEPGGIERIGIIHVDDSFGADLFEGARRASRRWPEPSVRRVRPRQVGLQQRSRRW